jgi:hypothetical protein
MKLPSKKSVVAFRFILFPIFALVGCTTSAPPLPTDTTAVNRQSIVTLNDFSAADAAMNCTNIVAERKSNQENIDKNNKAIEANRTQNQVAGVFGSLFIVPYIATEGNYSEKDSIEALNKRQDILLKLSAVKHCPQ